MRKIKWQNILFDCGDNSVIRSVKKVFLECISDGHDFGHEFSGIKIGIVIKNRGYNKGKLLFESLKEYNFKPKRGACIYRFHPHSIHLEYCIDILVGDIDSIKSEANTVTLYAYIDPRVVAGDKPPDSMKKE